MKPVQPFARPELVMALPPQPVRWLLPGLLPADSLALLDGPSGVGKTLLAAALAAEVTRTPFAEPKHAPRVAWVGDDAPFEHSAYPALFRHGYEEGLLFQLPVSRHEVEQRAGVDLMWDFIHHLETACDQLHPHLIVIDGLEDHLAFLADLKPADVRRFYRNLHAVAEMKHTCILVLRTGGLHRPGQGGALNRLGSDLAPVNLVLAWHPHEADRRVLVVAKNKLGPAGRQHLVSIDESTGRLTREPLAPHARLRPLTATPMLIAPRPDHPNAVVPAVAEKVIATLTAPMTAEALRGAILALGYTYTAFRKALRAAGARCVRHGDTWWYLFDHHTLPAGRRVGGDISPLSPPGRGAGGEGDPLDSPCWESRAHAVPPQLQARDHDLTTPDGAAEEDTVLEGDYATTTLTTAPSVEFHDYATTPLAIPCLGSRTMSSPSQELSPLT